MTIMWKFCTHPSVRDSNGRSVVGWVIDRELEKNITTLLQSNPNADEKFLAKLLLKNFCSEPLVLALLTFWGERCLEIQTRQPVEAQNLDLSWFISLAYPLLYWRALARRHLSCFLYRVGEPAANEVHSQLIKFPQYAQLQFDKCDVWQIAWSIATDPAKIFKNFDFERPLEKYSYGVMKGKIKDQILRLGMEKMSSNWALLKKSTQISVKEALRHQGYKQTKLDCYLLAWNLFKQIYAPQRPTGSRSLPAPTGEQFDEIANLYNQQVRRRPQLATLGAANRKTIEAWLTECIQALRNYQTRHRVSDSINAPSGRNEDSAPLSEIIFAPSSNSQVAQRAQLGNTPDSEMWEQLENQEPAEQLKAVLLDFLPQKPRDTSKCKYLLLLLICGLDLDYRSIAPIFGVCHTTVNRRYKSEMQRLLTEVAKWAQKQLGVTPDSENLERMRAELNQFLNEHYRELIFQEVFQNALQQLDQQRRKLLHLGYSWEMNEAEIARELQLPEPEVSNGLVTGRQELATAIAIWIQTDFNLNLPPELVDKIAIKVRVLIKNY